MQRRGVEALERLSVHGSPGVNSLSEPVRDEFLLLSKTHGVGDSSGLGGGCFCLHVAMLQYTLMMMAGFSSRDRLGSNLYYAAHM